MWKILQFDTIDSTNAELKRRPDAAHGTVICSVQQTQGRGRLGRSFQSPQGGLYLSVLLRRTEPAEQLLHLTPMAAVAVRRAILDACGIRTQIKWINDLVLHGKKVCGILTELAGENRIILGIGLNCTTQDFPPEIEDIATSLHKHCSVDLPRLKQAIIVRLQELDAGLFSKKAEWMQEYAAACLTLGQPVQLLCGGTKREAFAEGIDENGGLLVRFDDGTCETVAMGEVSVRGLYGYI